MGNTTVSVLDSAGAAKALSGVTDSGNSDAVITKHLPVDSDGTVLLTEAAAAADTTANPTAGGVRNFGHVFNGTTWDRQKGAPGATGVAAVSSDGSKATYSTGASLFTLPAAPSDVVEIKGSGTKTVRIKRISVSGQAGTSAQFPLTLIRRVAAITGGTPVTPSITKFDKNDVAATAVVSHFTALGTPAAANPENSVLYTRTITLVKADAVAQEYVIDFCKNQDKAIVLRGAADCLVINLGAQALVSGEKLSYTVEWEEDGS